MSDTTRNPDTVVAAGIARAKQVNKRLNVRIPVRISTIDPETDPRTGKLFFSTFDEFSANISRGGAFITTPEPIDPGCRVLVEIDIPNGSSIQAIGRVVWKRIAKPGADSSVPQRPGIGIQFTSGRPDLLNELDRYINLAVRRRKSAKAIDPSRQVAT
jgi:Tfp pilus assembly protein PilZ